MAETGLDGLFHNFTSKISSILKRKPTPPPSQSTQPLELLPMEQKANETALKIKQVFDALPPTYKRYAMFGDFVLIFANLKAGTDYSFLGDTYDPNEFGIFKKAFEAVGFRITEPIVSQTLKGDYYRQGYVYNPKTLEQTTKNSKLVKPYNQKDSLEQWITKCESVGIPYCAIDGKLFSFPESAIRDFLAEKKFGTGEKNKKSFSTVNETYWVYEPAQNDVIEREQEKQVLFDALEKNPIFSTIANCEERQQSDQLWKERLPMWKRKK